MSPPRPPLEPGPFFHGTRADLRVGDLLRPGFRSNYRPEVVMNHIYFTALRDGAGLAAELAPGDGPPRVYLVEPTGAFENDPNVTDKRFPGNPTRSYRSSEPLLITREVDDWQRLTAEELQAWRDRLRNITGEIINSSRHAVGRGCGVRSVRPHIPGRVLARGPLRSTFRGPHEC